MLPATAVRQEEGTRLRRRIARITHKVDLVHVPDREIAQWIREALTPDVDVLRHTTSPALSGLRGGPRSKTLYGNAWSDLVDHLKGLQPQSPNLGESDVQDRPQEAPWPLLLLVAPKQAAYSVQASFRKGVATMAPWNVMDGIVQGPLLHADVTIGEGDRPRVVNAWQPLPEPAPEPGPDGESPTA